MTEGDFLAKMAELLDVEKNLTMDSALYEMEEWDSLSFVSFLAMASSFCGKRIEPKHVRDAVTIGDLFQLLA
jgi:acyl carrier protein